MPARVIEHPTRVGDAPPTAPVPAGYAATVPPGVRDELLDHGRVRDGWSAVADELAGLGPAGPGRLRRQVDRLLDDDGVTYIPVRTGTPGGGEQPPARRRWELDPVPWVLDGAEWAELAAGMRQRATLLDLVLTDLYGPRTLLREGLLPPALILGSQAYLRRAHGIRIPGPHQLFLHAADVVRGPDGSFLAMGDRTEAPSGAGYAMADRRVVARVVPEALRAVAPASLAPFFRSFLLALQAVAPRTAEEPRVVVHSPGTHSETAFDQAALAGLLGLPLVESEDLTVREGRVWMRALGRREPVDVVLRRVDADWADPLDLRPDSRLGVVGLVQAARRGSVTVVNPLGSGLLENPGLLAHLPALARRLLDEDLRLPSAATFWCGEPSALSHVLAHFDDMVLRPTDGRGRSRIVGRLDRAAAAALRAEVTATPHRWAGQPYVPFSVAPVAGTDGVTAGQVGMRLFAVAQQTGYLVMPGGLGRVLPLDQQTRSESTVTGAKDVWVPSGGGAGGEREAGPDVRDAAPVDRAAAMSSPRALEDLFWFGRYSERAEDLARLLIATADRLDADGPGGPVPGTDPSAVLLATVTHASATYPGFVGGRPDVSAELRALVLDERRDGTVAQALQGLTEAAAGVRDQLSRDTWLVLAGVERALASLRRAPGDQGTALQDTRAAVLSGMLALSGLAAETMVRDPGWYLMDVGRRLERSLQLVTVLRWALGRPGTAAAEEPVIEAVLQFAESIVTHRRRYRGRVEVGSALELLVLDAGNPRSLAFQLQTLAADLRALPDASGTAPPDRLLDELTATVRRAEVDTLAAVDAAGDRTALVDFLTGVRRTLIELADAVAAQRFRHPAAMRQLDRPLQGRRGVPG